MRIDDDRWFTVWAIIAALACVVLGIAIVWLTR
jgi:hypothetical protein